MLSVVLPAYNEEGSIKLAHSRISGLLKDEKIEYEIVFVDDGSNDKTWECICDLGRKHAGVKGVTFSRNFGKESAILAGLAYSSGECCVILDCDLQHPPEVIIDMFRLWEQGYEVVEGVKKSRGNESAFHKMAAQTFYKLISGATHVDMANASDFKLLDRKAVDVLLKLPEKQSFFRALSSWIGFRSTVVEFEVQERTIGESKWSLKSLFKYAIINITSFSTLPLQFITILGIIFLVFSCFLAVQTLYLYFTGQSLAGFTTVIILLLLIGSVLMIGLGVIGIYISKIYEEVKGRPKYIISKEISSKQKSEND